MKNLYAFVLSLATLALWAQPTSVPTVPSQAQADVVPLFSDAYTGSPTLTPTTFGGSANNAVVANFAGNDVYQFNIVDGPFQAFTLGNSIDLTVMENLHYDIWIEGPLPTGPTFNTTLSYHAAGHLSGQTTGYVDTNDTFVAGQTGQWLSFDIPFSDFSDNLATSPRDIISEIVFTFSTFTSSNTIYLDNLYFWRTAVDPNTDASLSDLTVDGTTVTGFSPNTLSYMVELPAGTTTVPTVAATATQAGTGSSMVAVNPAASLPGATTVVVTAPDGTTTQNYTVNFTVAPTVPTMGAPNPTVPENNALSVYSDAYSAFTVDSFNLNAFQGGGTITQESIAGNNAILIDGLTFYGAQWDAVDVSNALDFINVRFHYWAASGATNFRFFLIDQTANIPGGAPEEPSYTISNSGGDAAIQTETWTEVVIPLSHFTNFNSGSFSFDLTDIFQYKFDATGSPTIYIDNLYFENSASLSTSELSRNDNAVQVYPNPVRAGQEVRFKGEVRGFEVFNMAGKRVRSAKANSFNTAGLEKGVYVIQVTDENGKVSNKKLIVK